MNGPAILDRLKGVTGKAPRWRAICPAHESKHGTRTLAIFEPEIGRVLLKCHAGCDVYSIISAVHLEIDALFPPRTDDNNKPPVRKPWRVGDLAAALETETLIAWVVLTDLAGGRPVTKTDRERAALAAKRCASLIQEMAHG